MQTFPACIQSSFSLLVEAHKLPWFISTCCLHTFIPSSSHVFYRRECFQFSQTGTVALAISAGNQHQSTFYWVSLIFIPCKTANVDFRLSCWIAFLMVQVHNIFAVALAHADTHLHLWWKWINVSVAHAIKNEWPCKKESGVVPI